ncbi:MAG: HAMP domain-containing histidine kinase [Bacteroidetes bacterium]|nr:HAMP domain-containing histidine kinase [Bacteroidota bacterium]
MVVELHFGWFPELKLHGYTVLTFSLTAINMLALSLMINASFNFILSRQQNLFIEQKQATKKFEDKSAELEKTNENLDNLVYSISHDIRSPLANIIGIADLGTRDATDDLVKSYFEKLDHNTEKLQHFTRMVTHFFMVDKAELKPVSIHLKHLVTSLFQDNYNDLLVATDSIRIDIPDNLVLNSDKTRLTLILMNLFSNSIKYKASERPLELKVAARNENSLIKLTIEDKGQGIDQDLMPRIFEMFTASDLSNAGSGLGLYIVSQCSKTLKGKINVVSEKNRFTRFEIDLPNLEALKREAISNFPSILKKIVVLI